ncbi:hypothetical protein NicSoilE8_20940 [Arthrobacter sp. NicSoilE8]|nr:hypothetical protein NicSoilE8_20940 [Arthrobacter sp. NicSoilE8]
MTGKDTMSSHAASGQSVMTTHVILTRFNLPSKGFESLVRAQDGWLKERINLFERYCLPSVQRQTNRDFDWIIYFDPESPEWLLRRIEELNAKNTFRPIFRTEVSPEELLSDIKETVSSHRPLLLTTNLDNDDALSCDFVQRVQDAATVSSATAIYLATGVVKSRDAVYLRRDTRNAFCSVSAPWPAALTCWAAWHNQLGRSLDVRTLRGDPAWLQVIHEHNVSNRIRGRRVSPAPFRTAFPGLLADIPAPDRRDILRDRLYGSPARALREGLRATAKTATIAVLGTEGIDRVKTLMASATKTLSMVQGPRQRPIGKSK